VDVGWVEDHEMAAIACDTVPDEAKKPAGQTCPSLHCVTLGQVSAFTESPKKSVQAEGRVGKGSSF
jgi:hypothetical protein